MKYYGDYDSLYESIDEYLDTHHYSMTREREEWLQTLWEEYNYEGYIDWDDKRKGDSFWYYYMTEILDFTDEDLEKYFT